MKRTIPSLALILLLMIGLAVPAAALSPVHTYQGQFVDIAPGDWYYNNVKKLYEFGLSNGKNTPDHFAPGDNITLAEAVTMAARLRSLYETGSSEAGPDKFRSDSTAWYAPYAAYLKSLSVIGREFDGSYDQPATRAQMAHILANTLPSSHFTAINGQAVTVGYASRRYIRDVTEYTPYQQEILTLYRWGILSGMDQAGSFHPDEQIQRCQAAAMITRLVSSELRITLNWDLALAYSKNGTTMEELVTSDGTFHSAPSADDTGAIDDNLRYMLSRGERRLVLSYGRKKLSESDAAAISSAFLSGMRFYVEHGYNKVVYSYSAASGTLVLTFSSSLYDDQMIDSYRQATMEAAIRVHDTLWENGTITSATTQYDKARAYYTWLCQNCVYDYNSTDTSLSHCGYSAFANGLAVCDGYTAAYNLLLKLEGIPCTTMSTPDHNWTVAELDGTTYHIDPTWGDQSGTISYRYFAMTEAASLARFPTR